VRALDVRRTLPQRSRSLIGAWCFLDHFGPDELTEDRAMHMPPHPHTGLQTVSWLFEGEVEHRDSTGAHRLVRPGEINLMTAGSGVQHSEYSTPNTRRIHGVQLWVALPDEVRDMPSTFEHHSAERVVIGDATALVFVGSLAGVSIPTAVHSPLVAAQLDLHPGKAADVPLDPSFEHGVLVDAGEILIDGVSVPRNALAYVPVGRESARIESVGVTAARAILIGGAPFTEPIVMWWNFIGRSHEEIERYRADWQSGDRRFGDIDDIAPRLPAPVLPNVALRPRAPATLGPRDRNNRLLDGMGS
jgi:redox-sensitive bicupin YhaK (pirin superfamily)